jgi:excisionase family DNA binding protein
MQAIPNEIYTLKEAEEILKLSRSTILRLIKKGNFRTVKIGRQHRILGKEILRIIKDIQEVQ